MDLLLLGTSFLAGMLTILAPCILPLLPVIIGGSAASQDRARPFIVVGSLVTSVVLFSLILKASTVFISIPNSVWSYMSGAILAIIGILMVFPQVWSQITHSIGFEQGSGKLLNRAGQQKSSRWSAVFIGAAMGPVFSSCSPTYFIILATVLPVSFALGIFYLLVYALGLALVLGLIAFFGQRIVMKLKWAADPKGWFKRGMGILLVIVGIALVTGFDKKIEAAVLDAGYGVTTIEEKLLDKMEDKGLEQESDEKEDGFEILKEEGLDEENEIVEKKSEEKVAEIKIVPDSQYEHDDAVALPIRNIKTNTKVRSIDTKKILGGGPPKDGIPAITNPKFISQKEAKVEDDVLGVYLDVDGDERFYPYTILVWHEITNDVVGGKPVAVTFCPLCGSAIVFNRNVKGQVLEFGVSGMLFESNLLMYDRTNESLWSQARGEAVVGDYTGTELEVLPMRLIQFSEMKQKYPNAKVMSDDTGYNRNYGVYPYGDYEETERLIFPVSVSDKRFFIKEIMYVVGVDDKSVSFPQKKITEGSTDIDSLNLTIAKNGGEIIVSRDGKEIPGYYEMWFSWATHHQGDGVVYDDF